MKKIVILALAVFSLFQAASSEIVIEKKQTEEVSPSEDLMREHGVLNRLMLIYQELARRIDNNEAFPFHTIGQTARIMKDFIENFHENLEEDYIFPHFEKANKHVELVRILRDQHNAGRNLTDYILSHSSETILIDEIQRMLVADYMRLFIRMFRPHEAREDTILFPAFRSLVSEASYKKLGKLFEEREEKLFGKQGFQYIIEQVSKIEKELDIYNLSQFTPLEKEERK